MTLTIVQLQNKTTIFNQLKKNFNDLKATNLDILINTVHLYQLGETKDSLFEKIKEEFKASDNWTAIRVNSTRNFTGAKGLLKIAKENGDVEKLKDKESIKTYIKENNLTINALYKKGQTPTIKEPESDTDNFNNALLKLIETFSKKLSKKEMFMLMQEAASDMYRNLKKEEQSEIDEELEKVA